MNIGRLFRKPHGPFRIILAVIRVMLGGEVEDSARLSSGNSAEEPRFLPLTSDAATMAATFNAVFKSVFKAKEKAVTS